LLPAPALDLLDIDEVVLKAVELMQRPHKLTSKILSLKSTGNTVYCPNSGVPLEGARKGSQRGYASDNPSDINMERLIDDCTYPGTFDRRIAVFGVM
jgi:hypothetical protein